MRVLLATTNKGKILELRRILGGLGVDVVGLEDCESTEEIETGSTFAENALLKARHYSKLSGLPTIADDSGLEVEALGGAPGLRSARYAGPEATDSERVTKLLDEMKSLPPESRAARFVCAAAIAWDGGERVFTDEARGIVLDTPRGHDGFGYDPVFYYEPLAKTFAELTPSEKDEVSHRGRAFRQLAGWLKGSVALDTPGSSDKIIFPTVESPASSIRGDV
ncbi:MAG TPA: RdgB/HAM1 family non-canonical purine NTP pyrophosphatase [Blastocatellia bacterium]|nr:RdgB/HAM1 family non-canonical purine NTP pyrophosphatase [Blastocatellia bacterium]